MALLILTKVFGDKDDEEIPGLVNELLMKIKVVLMDKKCYVWMILLMFVIPAAITVSLHEASANAVWF